MLLMGLCVVFLLVAIFVLELIFGGVSSFEMARMLSEDNNKRNQYKK